MTITIKDSNEKTVHMLADGTGTQSDPFVSKVRNDFNAPQMPLFGINLDSVGDGTGLMNQNVDGSVTPVSFSFKPPSPAILYISQIILYVEDAGSFDADSWGNGITMSNGIQVELVINSESATPIVIDLLNGQRIKTSGDVDGLTSSFKHLKIGSGNEIGSAIWKLKEGYGQYLTINSATDDLIRVIINDDLTGLFAQRISIQGYNNFF